jgi:hypothetical protein
MVGTQLVCGGGRAAAGVEQPEAGRSGARHPGKTTAREPAQRGKHCSDHGLELDCRSLQIVSQTRERGREFYRPGPAERRELPEG